MNDAGGRQAFLQAVLANGEQRVDQFSAAVWFDATRGGRSQSIVSTLLSELEAAGMPHQHRTRFAGLVLRSATLLNGTQPGTVRLNPARLSSLDTKYAPYLQTRKVQILSEYLPLVQIPTSRRYLRRLVEQLNGCVECGYFDAGAVMARRVVEVLLIEIYVTAGRVSEIQPGGVFLMLDRLISKLATDAAFVKSRSIIKDLEEVKAVGDTAAHSRVHIATKADVDDLKFKFRRLVSELVALSGLLDG